MKALPGWSWAQKNPHKAGSFIVAFELWHSTALGSEMKKAQSRETGPCWGNRNAGRSGKQLSERDGVDLLLDGVQQLSLQHGLLPLNGLLLGGQSLHLLQCLACLGLLEGILEPD
ncbi:hypothetical protein D3C76_711370 [compost metagenome]